MATVELYRDGVATPMPDPAAAIAAAGPHDVVWADILVTSTDDGTAAPDAGEALAEAARMLGWPPVVVSKLQLPHTRASLHRTATGVVLVLLPARYLDDTESVEVAPLVIAVQDRSVLTVRSQPWIDLTPVREFVATHRGTAEDPLGILWAVCERVVEDYTPVIAGVENDIDEIEEQLTGDDADVSRRIFALQRELAHLDHATAPLPELLTTLADESTGDRVFATALRTTGELAGADHRRIAGLRQTLSDALTVHATLVGQEQNAEMARMTEFSVRQNDQVKKISSWAAIGFAPSLVAGIYGMNFHYMPELSWPWGYPAALGLMVAVAGALYWVFKRHDWL